jgi:hypothetical protein
MFYYVSFKVYICIKPYFDTDPNSVTAVQLNSIPAGRINSRGVTGTPEKLNTGLSFLKHCYNLEFVVKSQDPDV